MATIEKALEIAARAHAGEKDRQGAPYVLHPLRVMHGVEGEAAQIVAVLHDVVEDTDVTLDDLRAAGFSEEVLAAVDAVSRREGEPFADYIVRCKADPIARRVKLSDLRDNSRPDRVLLRPNKREKDVRRLQRYIFSYHFLTDRMTEGEYREAMKDVS
ncbi:MAG TPA: HD domain-containing protein [Gemmataceae bacterium]